MFFLRDSGGVNQGRKSLWDLTFVLRSPFPITHLLPLCLGLPASYQPPPIISCCPWFEAVAPSPLAPALYLPLYCKRPLLQSRGYGLFPQSPSCSGASWAGSKGSTPLPGGLLCSTHHAPRLLVKGRFCLRNPPTFLNTYSRALSTLRY